MFSNELGEKVEADAAHDSDDGAEHGAGREGEEAVAGVERGAFPTQERYVGGEEADGEGREEMENKVELREAAGFVKWGHEGSSFDDRIWVRKGASELEKSAVYAKIDRVRVYFSTDV